MAVWLKLLTSDHKPNTTDMDSSLLADLKWKSYSG